MRAARSDHGGDAIAVAFELDGSGLVLHLRAAAQRGIEIALQDAERADVPIGGAEAPADHAVEHDRGVDARDVIGR